MAFWRKGQGESLIKILVIAIIAIIALALAKSYFQKTSKKTQETVEDIFSEGETTISTHIGGFSASARPVLPRATLPPLQVQPFG